MRQREKRDVGVIFVRFGSISGPNHGRNSFPNGNATAHGHAASDADSYSHPNPNTYSDSTAEPHSSTDAFVDSSANSGARRDRCFDGLTHH